MNEQSKCSVVREKLPLYVGNDLDMEGQKLVRSHLGECGSCARDAAAAARSREIFLAHLGVGSSELLPSAAPSRSLWAGVRAELVQDGLIHSSSPAGVEGDAEWIQPMGSAQGQPGHASSGRLLWGRFGGRLVAAAAAILAAIYLGPALLSDLDGKAPAGTGGQNLAEVTEIQGGAAPMLVGLSAEDVENVMAPDGMALSPQERGMRPLLKQHADLLRDAQPLIYRAPSQPTSGTGASQLAGYSGAEKRKLR